MAFAPGAYARAAAQLLNGQVDAGLAGLRAAVAADSLTVDPALRLDATRRGISALRQGQVQPAVDAMTVAVAAAPQAPEAHRLLATAQIVHGDVDAGIQHLRDAVRLNPKNERAWLALGRTLDDIGRTLDAADVLRRAVAELPDAGEIRWQLSVISGKRQQTDQADLELIASADRLVLLAGNGELYSRVARLAQAHLDYARGIALLERAVALTPNSAKAHQALGRGYVDQGREDEGYAELVVALWLDPGGAETLAALGRLQLAADPIPQAMDVLTRAVAVEPANAPAVNALGETLLRAGRATEGQERLEESRRLQARAVDAQRRSRTAGMLSLQAELAMTQRDYARAIDTWEQAAEMEPRNITIRLGLADALIATKRLTEAIPALQAATSLDAGADVHRRLADVYAALGRPDDSTRERLAYTEQRLTELRQAAGGSR
jgi:tetratricopeptide (TPR) repeat protein